MKTVEINHHLEQATKIRSSLKAGSKPIRKIKKPRNMPTKIFDQRIIRLANHEAMAAQKILAGVKQWITYS